MIAADLLALYGVDVYDGDYRVPVVAELVNRLPYEPSSMWRARRLGGDEWLGWGPAEMQRADLIDIGHVTMKATARRKAKLKDDERARRPARKNEGVIKADASDEAQMNQVLMGLAASING